MNEINLLSTSRCRPLQGNFLHLIEYANESRNSEKCHAALTVGLEEV